VICSTLIGGNSMPNKSGLKDTCMKSPIASSFYIKMKTAIITMRKGILHDIFHMEMMQKKLTINDRKGKENCD